MADWDRHSMYTLSYIDHVPCLHTKSINIHNFKKVI